MGWNFRKSVNLGGGLRLNFSKSGIGISGGVKGFRVSSNSRGKRLYASIPGTGIYYTKSLGGSKKNSGKKSSNATNPSINTGSTYQFTQTVSNPYTGETRELRARTQFELNQLVHTEQARQAVNEQRQKQLEAAQDTYQRVNAMNQQLQVARTELGQLINHTLTVCDRLDWDSQMVMKEFPPINFTEKAPESIKEYKLPFFKSLFMNEKKFELPNVESEDLKEFESRRNAVIADYLKQKAEFDKEKNKKNGEMMYLKKRFEESDKEAVERYVSIVLSRSEYPSDFEHDFDVKYDKEKKQLSTDFLFQNIDAFPIVDRYAYNQETNLIDEIMMDRGAAIAFYSDILYSVGIRTIHEILEAVYTDAIDVVCFNGYIEDEGSSQCAFAMRANRKDFEQIDLRQPVAAIIGGIESRTIGDFTKAENITPFE